LREKEKKKKDTVSSAIIFADSVTRLPLEKEKAACSILSLERNRK